MARPTKNAGNNLRANRLRNALRDNLARRKENLPAASQTGEGGETARRRDRLVPKLARRNDTKDGDTDS
ncbi:MAG: hypothetical protein R3D32_07365 [Nitratireductor sp.]